MRKLALLLTTFSMLAAPAALADTPSTSCTPQRMLLVVDRSSSMLDKVGGETKWTAAEEAVSTIASGYENKIDLGLMIFPEPNKCSPGTVVVAPGAGNAGKIADAMKPVPPSGGAYTPMSQSIKVAAADPAMAPRGGSDKPTMVVITDGWQWCDPYDPSTRFFPVDEVKAAKAAGITVHVIGFGAGVDVLTLNRMADAAGTALPGCDPTGSASTSPKKCYRQANDHAEILAALDAIAVTTSAEICDGIDNDCDGLIDEDLTQQCSTACGVGTETCVAGAWQGCTAQVPSDEMCDGDDNNCDGTVDEGCDCKAGDTMACGNTVGECAAGEQTCQLDGTWSKCTGAVAPKPETCDGKDNDCDGKVDDDAKCPTGTSCKDGACQVDDVPPATPRPAPTVGAEKDGCKCDATPTPASTLTSLLLCAIVALLLRRNAA